MKVLVRARKNRNRQTNKQTDGLEEEKVEKRGKKNTQLIEFRFGQTSNLVLMRYCAKATDSAEPVMVMVRSVLLSRSSQLDMRIMAPLICLWSSQNKQNERQIVFWFRGKKVVYYSQEQNLFACGKNLLGRKQKPSGPKFV